MTLWNMCEICVTYVWNMCETCELLLNYISWSTSYTLVLRSIGPIGPLLDGLFSFLSRSNSLGPAASRGQCRPGFDSDLGGCEITMDRHEGLLAIFQKAFWKIAMAYHFNILAISIPTFAGVLPKVLPFFMKPEQLRYIGGLFSSDRWYVELGLEKHIKIIRSQQIGTWDDFSGDVEKSPWSPDLSSLSSSESRNLAFESLWLKQDANKVSINMFAFDHGCGIQGRATWLAQKFSVSSAW